jgi:hypothetical protein
MENTDQSSKPCPGIYCNRVDGTLRLPHGHKFEAFKLVERRYMAAITTTVMLQLPVYSITVVFEDQKSPISDFLFELDQKSWQESIFNLAYVARALQYSNLLCSRLSSDTQKLGPSPSMLLIR